MAADLAGYTRNLASDETGTIDAALNLRVAIINPIIASHHGRFTKTKGDGYLIEFAAVISSVQAATDLQRKLKAAARTEPENRRIRFRIGTHIGDIVLDDKDFFGDDVIGAARSEPLVPPMPSEFRMQLINRFAESMASNGAMAARFR